MVHKIPSCAFRARPENSQILFRWMSMATPLPYNIFDLSLFTAKATPFPSMYRSAGKAQSQKQKFLEGRGPGRENLFPKRFSSPQAFLPSNLQAPACHSQNKKIPGGAGTIRTTRKAGGLLWPCKGLLPAAPKDAGFHAVQAQCPCRLGYPLKGS